MKVKDENCLQTNTNAIEELARVYYDTLIIVNNPDFLFVL